MPVVPSSPKGPEISGDILNQGFVPEESTPEAPVVEPVEPEKPIEPVEPKEPVEDGGGEEEEKFLAPTHYTVKGQELEYPDWAKEIMKDEESAKTVREVMEKYSGFDHVKQDRDYLGQQVEYLQNHIQNELSPVVQQVNLANQCLQAGNLDAFFQTCNIPPQNIVQWALNYAQQTPAQRQANQQQAQAVVNNYHQNYASQNEYTSLQQQLIQARQREVDLIISRPEVATVSQQLDQRFGRIGVLKDEIIRRGQMYAQAHQDVPAEQLLNEVLALAGVQPGPVAQPNGNGTFPGASQRPGGQPVQQRVQKPVIRNVGSGGRSPARATINTMADLKKRREALEAQGR